MKLKRLLGWVGQPDCQQTSMLCSLASAKHGLPCGLCNGEKGIQIWPRSVCSAL